MQAFGFFLFICTVLVAPLTLLAAIARRLDR